MILSDIESIFSRYETSYTSWWASNPHLRYIQSTMLLNILCCAMSNSSDLWLSICNITSVSRMIGVSHESKYLSLIFNDIWWFNSTYLCLLRHPHTCLLRFHNSISHQIQGETMNFHPRLRWIISNDNISTTSSLIAPKSLSILVISNSSLRIVNFEYWIS